MFCTTCHDPNVAGVTTCDTCDARLPDRRLVYAGQQFVLLNAGSDNPIAIGLDGPPVTVFRPTIISRYRHAVAFGDLPGRMGGQWGILDRQCRTTYLPLPDQPRLDAPHLELTAVVTERRVYRPDDEAHIFIAAPDHPGGEVELEVRLADQQIMRETVLLNASGLALFPYADLEEGEYIIRVRRTELGEVAECRFSVAEFTLSPLTATLESHAYAEGLLRFRLRLRQLSVPYAGETQVALQCAACGDRVVQTQELPAQAGVVTGEFDLGGHDGPFKLQVVTPQGETALVDLPGSGIGERERIVINPLGRVAEASLLPGDDTRSVRGLHVSYGDVNAAPLRLESAVAPEARFTAASDYTVVQIVAHNPLSGESTVHEWRDVTRNDRLAIDVNPPFTLFAMAAATASGPAHQPGELAGTGLYESWTTVIRPPDLDVTLSAPDQAAPGDQITVSLRATSSPRVPAKAHCLLLAYDARLEHESPLPKLGKRQYEAIRDANRRLSDGHVHDAAQLVDQMLYRDLTLGAGAPAGASEVLSAMAPPTMAALRVKSAGISPPAPLVKEVQSPSLLVPPTREDFPELAYLELFEFEGQAERAIPLGDQIGTWRCRAYLVCGLDVLELTADVQAHKPLYAELDLPAIVAEGDQIEAGVTYHSEAPAVMTITLPAGETIQGMVMGHGTERFTLTGPGDVSVQLSGRAGQDWTTRSVKAPGIQVVTASRLDLLQAGETVSGQRVVVYPGMNLVLTDTIEALLRYPFG